VLAVLKSTAIQDCGRRKVLPAKGSRESAFGLTIHLQPGATKPRFESPQWNAQHGASFGTRHLVEVGHRERLPKQWFHPCENSFDNFKNPPFGENRFRVRLRGRNILDPFDFLAMCVFSESPLAQDHQSGIHNDAGKPGGECTAAVETVQVAIPGNKRILNRVFGVFSIAHYPLSDRHEFWLRGHKHLLKRFPSDNPRLGSAVMTALQNGRLAVSRPQVFFSWPECGQGLPGRWIVPCDKMYGSR
jgi:hypothetical protein